MRILFLLIVLIISFSCTTIQKNTKNSNSFTLKSSKKSLYQIINKKFPSNDAPEQFEKKIPSSPILLNSLICFKQKIAKIILAQNIIDFAYDQYSDTLFILHNDTIETSKYYCPTILLKKSNPLKIYALKGKIAVEYINFVNIYSLEHCGKIYKIDKSYPFFAFNGDYYVLFNRKNFEVYKLGNNIPYLFGKLNFIKCVRFKKNLLKIIGKDKEILADLNKKKFLPPDNNRSCKKENFVKLKDITIFKNNKKLYAKKEKKIFYKTIYLNANLNYFKFKSQKVLEGKNYSLYKFKKDNSSICFFFKKNEK